MGDDDYSNNTRHTVNFPNDYYTGIFEVTEAQYYKVVGGSSSAMTPKFSVSWNALRGSAGSNANPTTGFFATLTKNTGIAFDLPTWSMSEVAARAGVLTKYMGGHDYNNISTWAWVKNSGVQKVGTKTPNAWGIYDMIGSAWEWGRDTWNSGNMKTLQPNGLIPISTGTASETCLYYGFHGETYLTNCAFAYRYQYSKSTSPASVGFRVFSIKTE